MTPKHITDLFCDLAEYYLGEQLSEKTRVLDICTGSGGFLIGALRRIDKNIDNKAVSINQKNKNKEKARRECLIGVEKKEIMFVLAYANMRFHKDGKSSLYQGSSLISDNEQLSGNKTFKEIIADSYSGPELDSIDEKIEVCGPSVGMINPPYEEDVFEFIDSMLRYLKKGGIGIAIVPINTQSTNAEVTKQKNALLLNNTLLASILMPTDLFNGVRGSGAATSTCILVFKAHYPHKNFIENGGLTYLADWSIDGFKLIPKHGRFEQNEMWNDENEGYRKKYLDDLKKQAGEMEYILSTDFKKDIHKQGSIKSIRKPIHKFDHIERTLKKDSNGNIIYKKNKSPRLDKNGNIKLNKKGAPLFDLIIAKDAFGNHIPEYDETEVFINEDWNILDYVKTDYNELQDDDFIKTVLDYSLYSYMEKNNLLFEKEDEE